MKQNKKKFVVCFLTFIMVFSMACSCLAVTMPTPGNPGGAADKTLANILAWVTYIGYAFAMGLLIYLGIKYVTSSANEKADLKKGSINYVIGAVIIAGAPTLVKILYDLSSGITTGNG